jgi:prephenate dehydrogenase
MWRDIVLANRKNLLQSVDAFVSGLQQFRRILEASDAKAVLKYLETAKVRRDRWCATTISSLE